ncbi:MAG: ABC transporter ATP-binding protein [Candidatus Hodarchaeota archaeon]
MPKIELQNVTKMFDDGTVIATDNVNLTIDDGDFIFLLGPSGCGKTTLLRLIAGLIDPSEGTIKVNGKNLAEIEPENRNIGFVFQHFEIFPNMNVFQNVSYGLRVRGYDDEDIVKITLEALSLVNLDGKALQMPHELSIPEEQKVGLARAIATRSKILFLDEPLGKLDPALRLKFRHELRRIIKTLGLTAIQVTHDQEEAMSIGDKIIVMRQGKLLQVGTPEDLYYNPKTIFVANFFGETNFLEGFISNVEENKCVFHLHLGGPRFNVNLLSGHGLKDHIQAIAAYRIEDLEVFEFEEEIFPEDVEYQERDMPLLNKVKGIVNNAIFVGPLRRFIITLENGDEVHAKLSSNFLKEIKEGDEVLVGFHQNPRVFEYPKNLRNELSKA